MGTVNLQQATVASDNTVFAQLDLDVGPGEVAATARSMGVTTKLDGIPAEGLGGLRIGVSPLEMADAFATLASGGIHRNPIAIRKVTFPGRQGRPSRARRTRGGCCPSNVAYEVTRILHDNITSGTGTAAYTGCYGQAGKTGTTDNYVDAWFDGYQPNLATAVWVGYPQSNDIEMSSVHGITVFGGTFPADIWNAFYGGIGVPCDYFQVPSRADPLVPLHRQLHRLGTRPLADPPTKAQSSGAGGGGSGAGGYDPNAYAPGAGAQQPVPVPAPAPRRRRHRRHRRRPRRPRPRRWAAPGEIPERPGAARVGLVGLAGLLLCAAPLAAPGTALVPAAIGGGPDWLLGPYGGGTGIGPGAYLGLPRGSPSAPTCACCRRAGASPAAALDGDRRS